MSRHLVQQGIDLYGSGIHQTEPRPQPLQAEHIVDQAFQRL
jgi:hypothetical protein